MAQWVHFGNDGITPLDHKPVELPSEGFLWCDHELDEPLEQLSTHFSQLSGCTLDELHLEDLANHQHPSHFDNGEGYHLLIIRALSTQPLIDKRRRIHIDTRPAFFLCAPRLLFTYRAKDSRTFDKARQFVDRIRKTPTTAVDQFLNYRKAPQTPEELMIQIVSNLIDRYLESRGPLSASVDEWQSDLLNPRKRFDDWNALLVARNELNRLEAVAEDQTSAVSDWLDYHQPNLEPSVQVNVRDTLEHLERIVHFSKRLGANTEAAVQLHFSSTAHKTNEIVTVLTMLSAVFMPLTLITGVFGMNFDNMPMIHSPLGFWVSLAFMVLSIGVSLSIIAKVRGKTFRHK